MFEGRTVGAVIPTDRQPERVGRILEGLPPVVDRAYVVDDGSDATTWWEVSCCVAAHNLDHEGVFEDRIVTIREDNDSGIGWAITAGYHRALEDGIDATVVLTEAHTDQTVLETFLEGILEDLGDHQPLFTINADHVHV